MQAVVRGTIRENGPSDVEIIRHFVTSARLRLTATMLEKYEISPLLLVQNYFGCAVHSSHRL